MIASYGRPNQALPWERWVGDGISRVPILARVCEFALVVDTKSNNGGWQILGGMNFVEREASSNAFRSSLESPPPDGFAVANLVTFTKHKL